MFSCINFRLGYSCGIEARNVRCQKHGLLSARVTAVVLEKSLWVVERVMTCIC